MADIYLNNTGFYMVGDGIEMAQSCSDDPLFANDELCHNYMMLAGTLYALRDYDFKDDITVYNSTRLIDEFQGNVPCDSKTVEVNRQLRNYILTYIPVSVWFRKKDSKYIDRKVKYGQDTMINIVPEEAKRKAIQALEKQQEEKKAGVLSGFKKRWLNKKPSE